MWYDQGHCTHNRPPPPPPPGPQAPHLSGEDLVCLSFVSRCTLNSGARPHPLPPLTEITQHRCCFTQITRMEQTINSHYMSPSVSTLFFYLKFESEHEVRNLKIWILPVKTRVLLHRFERVFSVQVRCQEGLGESSIPCRLSPEPHRRICFVSPGPLLDGA